MVRLGKIFRRGVIQKCQYLWNHQSHLLQFWTQYTWGYALPLGGIVFVAMMSWGCTQVHKTYWGTFSGRKAKIDTAWSVPKCFPGCPVSCITVVTVIQWYFLPFHVRKMFKENKSSLISSSLHQWLPPWFIMKIAWNFQVDFITQLFINTWTVNLSTCLLFETQTTCAMRCGNPYLYVPQKARLIYQSIGGGTS